MAHFTYRSSDNPHFTQGKNKWDFWGMYMLIYVYIYIYIYIYIY